MSAKIFIKFLNNSVVEDDDLTSHTWMYGDEKIKPAVGKFFIDEQSHEEFRTLYVNAINDGLDIKLSEISYNDKSRLFIDIDGTQRIDEICNELSIYIKDNFNIFENIKIIKVQNSLNKDKYHIYAFQENEETKKLTNLKIKKHYKNLLINYLKEKYEEVDNTKALRMVYATKKEGNSKGIYAPEEQITPKIMKLFSIISTSEDVTLTPTYEHEQQAILNIEKNLKMKDERAAEEFTDEDVIERLRFILPIVQKHKYLDDFNSWFALVVICKKYGFPYDEIDELCSISEGYISGCIDSIYNERDTNRENKKGYTIGTAQYYLNQCDPDAYQEYKKLFFKSKHGGEWLSSNVLSEMYHEELGHSRVYLELIEDNVVLVDSKKWEGYIWDEDVKLWTPVTKEGVYLHIANTLENIAKILVKNTELKFNEVNDELDACCDQKSKEFADISIKLNALKFLKKTVAGILKSTRTKSHTTNVFEFVKHKLLNKEFTKIVNNGIFLFPIKGGLVVNLKTKEVRERTKEDLFSYESNVSIGDKNNVNVIKFFSEVMSEKEDRIKFLQQVLGYCLSGDIKAKRFFVFIGDGSNSKSVVSNIMNRILGEYSNVISKYIFVKQGRDGDRHALRCTPELQPLSKGCRLAYCSEIGRDAILNEDMLKNLTGDEFIDCNPKGKDPFKFKMFAKLMLLTNFTPEFSAEDPALLERFTPVHFEEVFAINPKAGERKRDTAFVENIIENHIDDVFAWLLEGSVSYWEKEDFDIPEAFQQKKEELKEENDDIGDFIATRVVRKIESSVQVLPLYIAYTSWCRDSNLIHLGRKSFITEICKRGFSKGKNSKNCVTIKGMHIQEDGDMFGGFD